MMASGYKPSPLDLSHVKLTQQMEDLVEKLADNAHNVWARERVKQGWTYGVNLVLHLVFAVCICGGDVLFFNP